MLPLDVAGQRLVLLPEKAALLPDHQILLIADAHFGKALSFRKLGVAVPRGTTTASLAVLDALIEKHAVRRVIFLGDFLHSAHVQAHGQAAPSTLGALARWRLRHVGVQLTLVRGNHDERAGDPPAALRVEVVDEPLMLGALALCHVPDRPPLAEMPGLAAPVLPATARYALAGHLHPCIHLGGRAHDRLRLPCFWFGASTGVLPAFGAFTGMHPIAAQPGDRVFVVGEDEVVELPPGRH